jgi:hypothetical protein
MLLLLHQKREVRQEAGEDTVFSERFEKEKRENLKRGKSSLKKI